MKIAQRAFYAIAALVFVWLLMGAFNVIYEALR